MTTTSQTLEALNRALGEVVVIGELAPAIAILTRLLGAGEGGYLRFPRYSVGRLGEAMLRVPPTALRAQSEQISFCQAPKELGVAQALVALIAEPRFGQRGAAALVFGRERAFAKPDVELVMQHLSLFVAADRRVRRFETLSGQNAGLTVLIEKRLGACAALASAQGDVLWMSQSARSVYGERFRV